MRKGYSFLFVVLLIAISLVILSPFTSAPVQALDYGMDTDLGSVDASFLRKDGEYFSGRWVAGAGDVNGDGYDDILIGAIHDYPYDNASWTYLIFGKASGWALNTNLSEADASFRVESKFNYTRTSMAGAGDVNGDGFDDILIGAYGHDKVGSGVGQIYLILGKASGWAMDTDLSDSDASFLGEDEDDFSGDPVAGAGDVNGDGYDDILIGAWASGEGGDVAGQTYLIFGKESGWEMDTNLSTSDASFLGEDEYDYSGSTVASAGDVNGDGYDDILIGATMNSNISYQARQTYLILGKVSGWAMDTNLSASDASFWGEDEGDFSGDSVSGVGDVNGDGYDDILIGAWANDDGGKRAGKTYLILGKPSRWVMDTELSFSDASFLGECEYDYSGYSVAGAGDVNGDGFNDILIGAYVQDEGGSDAGQTYLILGKASGWALDTDLSDSDASFWGESEFDYSGDSVTGVGDVNGDGYDDILIGAPGIYDRVPIEVQIYLIFPNHNSRPVLYDENLTPSYGDMSTMFHFSVTYKDIDGDEAANISLVIDGQSYPWTINESSRFDIKRGVLCNIELKLTEGIHQYYYLASDGLFDIRYPQTGEFSTPYVLKNITDEDSDRDGFYDIYESKMASDPYDEYSTPLDYDGDEWNNSVETEAGTDPRDNTSFPPDMDLDGIHDSIDPDRDGDGMLNEDDAFPDDRSKWDETGEINEVNEIVWWLVGIGILIIVVGVLIGIFLVIKGRKGEEDAESDGDEFGRKRPDDI